MKTNYVIFGDGSGWFRFLFEGINDCHVMLGSYNIVPWSCSKIMHYFYAFAIHNNLSSSGETSFLTKLIVDHIIKRIKNAFPSGAIIILSRSNSLIHNQYFASRIRGMGINYKTVYWFTDLVSEVLKTNPDVLEYCQEYIDKVVTYDPSDAKEYGFTYIETPYSFASDGSYVTTLSIYS